MRHPERLACHRVRKTEISTWSSGEPAWTNELTQESAAKTRQPLRYLFYDSLCPPSCCDTHWHGLSLGTSYSHWESGMRPLDSVRTRRRSAPPSKMPGPAIGRAEHTPSHSLR